MGEGTATEEVTGVVFSSILDVGSTLSDSEPVGDKAVEGTLAD